MLSELAQKKLILISGKGGVGKTTLSAALGLRLQKMGRRVLVAEINGQGQMAALFNEKPLTYTTRELRPGLSGMNVIPMKAFEEYVLLQLKFKAIYSAVFDNKFVRYFIEGAPGLADLMAIGKIYSIIDDYDTVIVDAPATGHGMSLLQIPTVVAEAVRVGPLKTHSQNIEDLLKDTQRTALVVVTLPEEMPVAETLEVAAWTRTHLDSELDRVYVNAVVPPLFADAKDYKTAQDYLAKTEPEDAVMKGLRESLEVRQARSRLHAHYIKTLRQGLPGVPMQTIPYCFAERIGVSELETIAAQLGEA